MFSRFYVKMKSANNTEITSHFFKFIDLKDEFFHFSVSKNIYCALNFSSEMQYYANINV